MNFKSTDEILNFAIKQEEEAEKFYLELASNMKAESTRTMLESFAAEERTHNAKLLEVKNGKHSLPANERVLDLKIADYTVEPDKHPDMNFQDALLLAMKTEEAAFKLYNDLSEATDDKNLKNLFQGLAVEESKHKLKFEIEYDNEALKEN